MAKEKTESAATQKAAVVNEAKATPRLTELQQSVYTADEFANMHDDFNTTADMVKTALVLAGKDRCSYAEAEKIIKKFLTT